MIEAVSSKDICKIVIEVLRLIDKRLIAHSERVAYIIWKMMDSRGGYEEYEVRPVLGGLEWMEGDVPTPNGKIHIEMDRRHITIRATEGRGTLFIGDQQIMVGPEKEVTVNY